MMELPVASKWGVGRGQGSLSYPPLRAPLEDIAVQLPGIRNPTPDVHTGAEAPHHLPSARAVQGGQTPKTQVTQTLHTGLPSRSPGLDAASLSSSPGACQPLPNTLTDSSLDSP